MRVNVYAEEMTDRLEVITKYTEDGEFTGLRFYLELPISYPVGGGHHLTHKGPFIHRPGDDDSSAVTFWGKQDLRKLLLRALELLNRHYDTSNSIKSVGTMVGQATLHSRDQEEPSTRKK